MFTISIKKQKINLTNDQVEIDNGIVKLSLINPTGQISGVSYNGIDNVLEPEFKESQRGSLTIYFYFCFINFLLLSTDFCFFWIGFVRM